MELRPYQNEAIQSIKAEFETRDKTLLVLPTGTGKTVVFSEFANSVVKTNGKVLVLAHREELLEQASNKMESIIGLKPLLEKAESTSIGLGSPLVVGSVQTLCRDSRLMQFNPYEFSHIIVDEAHHCMSDSYQKVLNYFKSKVLGVTATPDRTDKKNLGQFFESTAYEYSIRDAIRDGYLCPIKAQMIPLEIDLSQVTMQNGDYSASETGSALEPYLEQIADEMTKYCKGKKTVVFLPLVATSKKFCEILRSRGFKSTEVNGESKDRKEVLEAFDKGEYDVLCNSMLLTEGWDCPSVDCVICLRPTKSRSLFCQMIGRGTRLAPNKEYLLVLDFLWLTQKHSLCRPSCLVGNNESVTKKMDDKIKDSDKEFDILELEIEAESDVVKEREQALAEELKRQRGKRKGLVDPLQYAFSINTEDLVDYEPTFMWEMQPVTVKQAELLTRFGIDANTVANCGMAKLLLDHIFARNKEHMSTAKQIRFLESRGFKCVGMWSFNDASKMITRISNNHWMVPRAIDPSTYIPERLR